MRWRPQAELMDRSFLRTGPCRERHDARWSAFSQRVLELGLRLSD